MNAVQRLSWILTLTTTAPLLFRKSQQTCGWRIGTSGEIVGLQHVKVVKIKRGRYEYTFFRQGKSLPSTPRRLNRAGAFLRI